MNWVVHNGHYACDLNLLTADSYYVNNNNARDSNQRPMDLQASVYTLRHNTSAMLTLAKTAAPRSFIDYLSGPLVFSSAFRRISRAIKVG